MPDYSGYLSAAIMYLVGGVLFYIAARFCEDRSNTDDCGNEDDGRSAACGRQQRDDELHFSRSEMSALGRIASTLSFPCALMSMALAVTSYFISAVSLFVTLLSLVIRIYEAGA